MSSVPALSYTLHKWVNLYLIYVKVQRGYFRKSFTVSAGRSKRRHHHMLLNLYPFFPI